ncbi:MAG: Asp-tRNA(Asn)/Glu-tRNA(Gln) amidotransferase subunit GatC [Planctomycetes bacterium]|nr:Asp-tRNA(Asn)/Glu-tRNA(Gln) amidotransferase subunit GatC [Planctomycetota bacterium]MBI3834494.1 Asp-tRNA(Asn)/Glu-tRNA(Gln) amidotransferase subunit GatC [Planctomycetota bacterium]
MTTRNLDIETVRHVAHLARLRISDEEAALYAAQLSKIVAYVDQLNEVDTSNVEPTAHPLPLMNVWREDNPTPSWTPQQALQNAPQSQNNFFRVPKVLDQESP